jgi:hypothetical protein
MRRTGIGVLALAISGALLELTQAALAQTSRKFRPRHTEPILTHDAGPEDAVQVCEGGC